MGGVSLSDEYVRHVFDMFKSPGGPKGQEYIAPNLLMHALQQLGQNPTLGSIDEVQKKMDTDGDGVIDFDEFLTFYRTLRDNATDEDALRTAFAAFDADNSGTLTKDELYNALTSQGEALTREELDMVFLTFDLDGDGTIDYNEFCKMMIDRATQPPTVAASLLASHKLQKQTVAESRGAQKQKLRDKQRANALQLVTWFRDTDIAFATYSQSDVDAALQFEHQVHVAAGVNPQDAITCGFVLVTFQCHGHAPWRVYLSNETTTCEVRVIVASHFSLDANRTVLSVCGYNAGRWRGTFLEAAFSARTPGGERKELLVQVDRAEDVFLGPPTPSFVAPTGATQSLSAFFQCTVDPEMDFTYCVSPDTYLTRVVPVELTTSVETLQDTGLITRHGASAFRSGYYAFRALRATALRIDEVPPEYVAHIMALYAEVAEGTWARSTAQVLLHQSQRSLFVHIPGPGVYRVDFANLHVTVNEDILDPRNDVKYDASEKLESRGGRPYCSPSGWERKGISKHNAENDVNIKSWAAAYLGNEASVPTSVFLSCDVSAVTTQYSPSLPYTIFAAHFAARAHLGDLATSEWTTVPRGASGTYKRLAVMVRVDPSEIVEKPAAFPYNYDTPIDPNFENVVWEVRDPAKVRPYGFILREYDKVAQLWRVPMPETPPRKLSEAPPAPNARRPTQPVEEPKLQVPTTTAPPPRALDAMITTSDDVRYPKPDREESPAAPPRRSEDNTPPPTRAPTATTTAPRKIAKRTEKSGGCKCMIS